MSPALTRRPWALALLGLIAALACSSGKMPAGTPARTSETSGSPDGPAKPDASARPTSTGKDAAAPAGARGEAPDGPDAAPGEPEGGLATPDAGPTAPIDAGRPLFTELLGRFDEGQVRQLFAEMEQRSAGGRTAGSATYRSVADWIRDLLLAQAPALAVRFDDHGEYRNVEITIPGRDPDAGVFLLGAHLDTFPRTPGMDDNASGALGAALIAAALAHYRFAAEIRIVLFDAEEIGLIGSALYARALRDGGCQPNDCLRRYVNMDMIGHDPKDEALVWALTASPALPAEVASIARTHGIELEVRGGGDGCNESDDCSFSRLGYPTVYFNEAIPFSDLHTPRDTNAVIHFGTMVKILRLVAATLATWAGLEGPAP